MAKIYNDNINPNGFASSGTPYVNPFQRMDAFPLDRSEMFDSVEDAKLYALGGVDKRGLSGTAYVGQIISVVDMENGIVDAYQITSMTDEDNVLQKLTNPEISSDIQLVTAQEYSDMEANGGFEDGKIYFIKGNLEEESNS